MRILTTKKKENKMELFIRFTNEVEKDFERKNSFHLTPYDKDDFDVETMLQNLDIDEDELVVLDNGRYATIINGLCGFFLESDNLNDAQEEIKDNWNTYNGYNDMPYVIFEGETTDGDCPDGDTFFPLNILYRQQEDKN
jgi:hypothetical protein